MYKTMKRATALLFAGAIALAGCSGGDGDPGAPGAPGGDGTDGTNGLPGFSTARGLNITVSDSDITVNADNTVSVRFEMKDNRGFPVDRAGIYSINSAFTPRFGLAYITKDVNGNVLPYVVLSKSGGSPTAFTPNGGTQGTLVENGTNLGDYTYTFPASAALDPTKLGITHTIWIQAARQTDPADRHTIDAVNKEHNFIPSGSGTPERREVVSTASCNRCHNGFRIYSLEDGFHGGARNNANFCGICHNPERQSGRDASGIPAAEAARFVHRIHYSEHLRQITTGTSTVGFQGTTACTVAAPCTCTVTAPCQPTVFHGIGEVTYPQPVKNCRTCHEGALQGNQRTTRPNRAACGACHDYVDFVSTDPALPLCAVATVDQKNTIGCRHSGTPQADDTNCTGCHDTAFIETKHMTPIETPNNPFVPPGLATIDYAIRNVVVGADNRLAIEFQVKKDNVAVTFDPFGAVTIGPLSTQGFTSGPSFYAAYSVSFTGIASPADFDAGTVTTTGATTISTSPASVSLTNVWNGTQGQLLGPDPEGFYTAILSGTGTAPNTSAVIPAGAAMVTGVMIGSFSQANAESVTGLDLNSDGDAVDAASILAKAAYKVAAGFTGRRQIISDAKCSACHEQLGFDPDFHGGARNNGEICAICHNPVRNNSSWSGNMKDFIHGIHAGGGPGVAHGIRTNKFGWHADLAYWNVTYPSNLSNCEACHLPGTYDFTGTAYTANGGELLNRLLPSTASSSNVTSLAVTAPPWLSLGNYSDVGTDKSANLVVSPLTSPCLGCHDSPIAVNHMKQNGAQIYVSRGSYLAGTETCLVCHGAGRIAAIRDVHYRESPAAGH
jgi:OmcA/MtrC family decaheme c-type cytochrome